MLLSGKDHRAKGGAGAGIVTTTHLSHAIPAAPTLTARVMRSAQVSMHKGNALLIAIVVYGRINYLDLVEP